MLAGSHLVHDIGYLESGLTGSLAQVVICDEVIDWLRASLSPIEINDETLALDLIDEVGPNGDFLASDHTLEHFRDSWYPGLIERYDYGGWAERGGQDLGERAAARVDAILKGHTPEPLPEDVRDRLQEIVAAVESRAAASRS